MLVLESGQICPLGNGCPYNEPYGRCYGVRSERTNTFQCDYVVNGQIIRDGGIRLPQDKTGKMKVIME